VAATFKSTAEPRPKHSKNNIYILLNESSFTFNLQNTHVNTRKIYNIKMYSNMTRVIIGNQSYEW
jgi:hypothetical protein